MLVDLFLFSIHENLANNRIELIQGHISFASCLKRETPVCLSDTGMHFLSIFSNSNRTRQANELAMKSPSQHLYLPCYSSSSVYTGLFLLQSKLWGYGRKISCNEQEPLHLLAKRTFKVLKNEKLGQRTIQAQSIAFEFNVLKVPSDSDALCLMPCLPTYHLRVSWWLPDWEKQYITMQDGMEAIYFHFIRKTAER